MSLVRYLLNQAFFYNRKEYSKNVHFFCGNYSVISFDYINIYKKQIHYRSKKTMEIDESLGKKWRKTFCTEKRYRKKGGKE